MSPEPIDGSVIVYDTETNEYEPSDYVPGESQGGVIVGTGSPEGVVVAPVGSGYVDVAKTNGARKWLKTTGAGNAGWEVSMGNTGWRLLAPPTGIEYGGGAGQMMSIRRVNDIVYLSMLEAKITVNSFANGYIPEGFVGTRMAVGAIVTEPVVGAMRIYPNAGIAWYTSVIDGWGQQASIDWPTSDPWPTTLPGTAL